MRSLMILLLLTSLIGCGEKPQHKEQLSNWNYNLKLVKNFSGNNKLYMSSKGTCYLRYWHYNTGSVSIVNCEDFGVINEKPSTL